MAIQTFNLNTADLNFKNEVVAEEGGEHLKKCFQCSSCTLTCPVSDAGLDLNPRNIIRQVLVGMRKEVLESKAIWQCVGCYECTDRCPQNVRFTEIVEALRRIAVRESKNKDKNKRIRLSKEGKLKVIDKIKEINSIAWDGLLHYLKQRKKSKNEINISFKSKNRNFQRVFGSGVEHGSQK